MNNIGNYSGSCFCGEVKFSVNGKPEVSGYCHCKSCRHWSGSAMTAFGLWKGENVKILSGKESIGSYKKTPNSVRKFCKICGGSVMIEHPKLGLIDIPSSTLEKFCFQPALHVNYQEAIFAIKDGLIKYKDIPKEVGGSGIEIKE